MERVNGGGFHILIYLIYDFVSFMSGFSVYIFEIGSFSSDIDLLADACRLPFAQKTLRSNGRCYR